MKAAIVGLPQSGKKTIFEALTQAAGSADQHGEFRIATIRVPDRRVDALSRMYQPGKTTYARIEYLLPQIRGPAAEGGTEPGVWKQVRDCDALIHVIRNFKRYGAQDPTPGADFEATDQELMLTDMVVVEKRLERLTLDRKRGKAIDAEEYELLESCRSLLESETPLRRQSEVAGAHQLRGFALLSAKPMLVVFNNDDENQDLPDLDRRIGRERCVVIRGRLEQELSQMSLDEQAAFLSEFGIAASAMDRAIHQSYELLGLLSFFTVGEDEVRAWTLKKGTPAVEAAGVIHSDMEKGFIRAEVLAFEDLMDAGSYAAARKKGTVRLEGKQYVVADGDIIHFRFNV